MATKRARPGELKSVVHNAAASLGSGLGLPIGCYSTDIFGEASRSEAGYIVVDFLTGTTSGGEVSTSLAKAVSLYGEAFRDLCARHDVPVATFRQATARFAVDVVHGNFYVVDVEDTSGRRAHDVYLGMTDRRIRRGHKGPAL